MDRFEKLEFLKERFTAEDLLDILVKAMSEDEFEENFAFICREYDLTSEYDDLEESFEEEDDDITNVGLAMNSIENKDGIISGTAVIYSTFDGDDYEDDISFTYDISSDKVDFDGENIYVFDELEIAKVKEILIDNIKTNILKK